MEDTTAQHGAHQLHTDDYRIDDGRRGHAVTDQPHDMSDRENLAAFVARALDNAEKSGASQTWLDLVDHGGGDGGGLEADHGNGIMRADDIAGAVADGVALPGRVGYGGGP